MSMNNVKTIAEIAKIAQDVYHAFADRQKNDEAKEKDKRIKELEEENNRLKASQ